EAELAVEAGAVLVTEEEREIAGLGRRHLEPRAHHAAGQAGTAVTLSHDDSADADDRKARTGHLGVGVNDSRQGDEAAVVALQSDVSLLGAIDDRRAGRVE